MRILLAMNGSTASELAARALLTQPWPAATTVRVVTVADIRPPTALAPTYEPGLERQLQEAGAVAARAAEALHSAGLRVEAHVRRGQPAAEIVAEARDWGADLIVVGWHARSRVGRWVVGSVAEQVVRRAPCSVEVVRSPE